MDDAIGDAGVWKNLCIGVVVVDVFQVVVDVGHLFLQCAKEIRPQKVRRVSFCSISFTFH